MSVALPTEKTQPSLSPETIKALLYGPPKVGKSTLASQLDPNHTLFLATEPGLGALEVFEMPVDSWHTFREIGASLAEDPKQYRLIVIDTVDELYRMCSDEICERFDVDHPGDMGYGKVWAGISDEFRLRVGKLAGLGLGVWFVSHAKDIEIETRVGKITKTIPTVSGQARQYLLGFCDFLFYAAFELGEEGDRRILHTSGTENFEAGGRLELTHPLPLDAAALRKDLDRAFNASRPQKTARKQKGKNKETVSA